VVPVPSNPSPNPSSSAWLSKIADSNGVIGIGSLQIAANMTGETNDYGFPIYVPQAGVALLQGHCTESWGTCGVEGQMYALDPRSEPENAGIQGDRHLGIVDAAGGYESDFWGTSYPFTNGQIVNAWGGKCPLNANGYTDNSCESTATGTPLSIGIIRAQDVLAALNNPNGSLPYALQFAVKCSDGHVPPFVGSDGTTAGCMPQGSHIVLNWHDAQVNASGCAPIVCVIERTADLDHFGGFVTDTNGGQSGFSLQHEDDIDRMSFGLPGPLLTTIVPEACREGLAGACSPSNNDYYIQLTTVNNLPWEII
jgi:hypothetical protein